MVLNLGMALKKKKMVDMGITATKLSWYGLYQLE